MSPIDFRNSTFADLQSRLTGDRVRVLAAWRQHGPGTTRQIARAAGIDILTFRPRTTELYQLGAIMVLDPTPNPNRNPLPQLENVHEGVYQARTDLEWLDWLHARRQSALNPQLQLV